jgi:hypothetical protein
MILAQIFRYATRVCDEYLLTSVLLTLNHTLTRISVYVVRTLPPSTTRVPIVLARSTV